jgi:excisionase family DNA binding protein
MTAHTVKDVAALIGTTEDHVLALIHAKKVGAVNVGLGKKKPRWRITPEALANFLAARSARDTPRRRCRRECDVIETFYR